MELPGFCNSALIRFQLLSSYMQLGPLFGGVWSVPSLYWGPLEAFWPPKRQNHSEPEVGIIFCWISWGLHGGNLAKCYDCHFPSFFNLSKRPKIHCIGAKGLLLDRSLTIRIVRLPASLVRMSGSVEQAERQSSAHSKNGWFDDIWCETMRDLQKAFDSPPLSAEELVGFSVGSLSRATRQWSGYMAHVHRSTHKNKAIIVLIGTIFWTCESSSSFAASHWITMHSDEILGGYEFFMSLAQSPRSWSWAVWRKPWPMWPHPWRHGQHRHHMMVMVKPRNRQAAGALGTNSLQAPWRRQGLCGGDFFRWIENFHQLSHSKPSFWLIWLMCWFVICFMYRFLALWLITLHVNETVNELEFPINLNLNHIFQTDSYLLCT